MIQKIGVIGAGQMGRGIAQVIASNHFHTILVDPHEKALNNSKASIKNSLDKLASKDKLQGQKPNHILERIKFCQTMEELPQCDLYIEAVPENEHLKIQVIAKVNLIKKKSAIIASNTSSISITKLASACDHPDRFLGLHFMNPVPIMQLVEIIPGFTTQNDVVEIMREFMKKIGKRPVTSKDYPGFVVNRILMPMINEAFFVLQEDIAAAKSIDTAMQLGTNQPMGPLQLADFIGLDTCLAIMEVLHENLGDSKYRPSPLLRKYVEAGRLGKKSQKGVYSY